MRALEPPLPQPDPSGGGARQPPCRSTACRKRIEQFCKRVGGCGKFSERFRKEGRGGARKFKEKNLPPKDKSGNRSGWELHHIVPVLKKGISDFAQSVLNRAGVDANVKDNLLYLRASARQLGKPGYDRLSPELQARFAHADALTNYYYQPVNERFVALIRRVGDEPTKNEVQAVLREIKADLEDVQERGRKYIEPRLTPRFSALSRP